MWPASAPRVLTLAKWPTKPWADLAFTNPWGAQPLRDWECANKEPFEHQLPRNVKKIPHGTEMRTTMEAVAKHKYSLPLCARLLRRDQLPHAAVPGVDGHHHLFLRVPLLRVLLPPP